MGYLNLTEKTIPVFYGIVQFVGVCQEAEGLDG
jgi:hypothetical protein